MRLRTGWTSIGTAVLLLVCLTATARAGEALPGKDVVTEAIVDELSRSMQDLALDDLPKPYFVQYNAQDRLTITMRAAYGALLNSDEFRFRMIRSRVRVGGLDLDNTNLGFAGGGRASLPLDDDYIALRHAIWRMTDGDYKHAVEALTRKQAFLKQKNVVDRPDDFTPATCASAIEPSPELVIDRGDWEGKLRALSGRFARHTRIQDADVSLFAGAVREWVIQSEGARLRTGDTGVLLAARAELQAAEGMLLADRLSYLGQQVADLPPTETIQADIDEMCGKLVALAAAPVLDEYTGPVLFEPVAAGKVFHALLAEGLCARPVPLGRGGSDESLEKKLGRRILPSSFTVIDDPDAEHFEGTLLAGAYKYDDEAVPAQRVVLVEDGVLKAMLASRAPTKKTKATNGHGRTPGYGDATAHVGCLYFADSDGKTPEELKAALIEAARDEGLEFGLRVEAIEAGGHGGLGDPIYAYKVYVEDGREELVRGIEFRNVKTRDLKRILAAGRERKVYNQMSGVATSIIAPAALFEELELVKIEREFDRLPILKPPALRDAPNKE